MKLKSIWKKIWEPEDSHLFGELFLIIGSFLLVKSLELFLPNLNKWFYLAFGFLFVWRGIKLIRKAK